MVEIDRKISENRFERALTLQGLVKAFAVGEHMDETEYSSIRSQFVRDASIKQLLPPFIRFCRDNDSLWTHLKEVCSGSGAYQQRRIYIDEAFMRLLDYLENVESAPSDSSVSDLLLRYDGEGVHAAWAKALERRSSDPQGAITSARTLLEEVCKHILEDANVKNAGNWDLPKLYSETSRHLNLAPSQHTEEVFRRILGGCNAVVENLGALRNKISDAHGHGRLPVKPLPRHAALAVNLSGSMAMFLVETWLDKEDCSK